VLLAERLIEPEILVARIGTLDIPEEERARRLRWVEITADRTEHGGIERAALTTGKCGCLAQLSHPLSPLVSEGGPMPDPLFDELRQLFSLPLPLAPDRPRGFVPQLWWRRIRRADQVSAVLPDGSRVLVLARAESLDLHPGDCRRMPARGLAVEVPCEDDEDVDVLRLLVADATGEGGVH
jgi:hypothetical protein